MPIDKFRRKSSPALITQMAEVMLGHQRSIGECTDVHLQEAGFTPRQITDHAAAARSQAASMRKLGSAIDRATSP